jgi:O-methyltransferase
MTFGRADMLARSLKALLRGMGLTISRVNGFDADMEEDFRQICRQSRPYTITSMQRMYALYAAMKYVVRSRLPGDFVECGVWQGGSAMVAASTLRGLGDTGRKLYLFDTYTGTRPVPTKKDVNYLGEVATDADEEIRIGGIRHSTYASLDDVRRNIALTGYPLDQVVFVEGKVEDTIPGTLPSEIAVLRLDTDLYASTYHELVHLFPKLVNHGVLILDDYGSWRGAAEAAEQYFSENGVTILLHKIDSSGRIAIKA